MVHYAINCSMVRLVSLMWWLTRHRRGAQKGHRVTQRDTEEHRGITEGAEGGTRELAKNAKDKLFSGQVRRLPH